MNVNYDSGIINKFGASLTDDARVIIYDVSYVYGTGNCFENAQAYCLT